MDVMSLLDRWSSYRRNGYVLATTAIAAALGLRLLLEPMGRFYVDPSGRFYYVPLVLGVVATAFLTERRAIALAITLSISANLFMVPRAGIAAAVVDGMLFAALGVMVGELGRARRILKLRSSDLSSQLDLRQAMLNAMLTSTPVATLSQDGAVRYMSPVACQLFKVSETEAIGRPFQGFVDSFDLDAAREQASDGYGAFWTGRRSDGETFPLDIQPGYMPGDDQGCRVVLCLTDLSGWHASELRNQELALQLNHVWRLNSLGEMGAILAHELNQPLTAATLYLQASQADLNQTGVFGDSANRTIDMAKGQLLRAGNIIQRMRSLLIIEGRALQPERVSSMIDDLNPIIALLAPEARVQVRIEIDDDNDLVLADGIQFQQAMVNLIRNAIEAVADSDRREVLIVGGLLPDGRFGIGVEDSGPGIAPGKVAEIFQPLTTSKSNGMGLGLSVTRTIVERHGGALTVRRSDLGGAAFELSLART